MAIENNYGGPPSLKIYQDFVRSVSLGDLDQNVAIVAQQYDVYDKDNTTEKLTKEYKKGEANQYTWEDLELDGKSVDKDSVSLYFENADIVQCVKGGCTVAAKSNELVFAGVSLEDFQNSAPEAIIIGDTVMVGNKIATTTWIHEDADTEYKVVTEPAKGVTINDKAFIGSDTVVGTYYVTVSDVQKSTTDTADTIKSVTLKVVDINGTTIQAIKVEDFTKEYQIEKIGMAVKLDKSIVFKVGEKLANIIIKAPSVNTVVMISDIIEEDLTNVEAQFCKKFKLTTSDLTADTNAGITVGALKSDIVLSNSAVLKGMDVVSGTCNICLRAKNTESVNKLQQITYDNLSSLGMVSIQNPIAAMVSVALKGGRPVFAVSVSDDTRESYRKAFSTLSKSSNAYAVVLGSLDAGVISECYSFIEQQADPSVANYKIMYYGLNPDTAAIVMDSVLTPGVGGAKDIKEACKCTIADGVLTIDNDMEITTHGFVRKGVRKGDIIVIGSNRYSVAKVLDNERVQLEQNITESYPFVFTVVRNVEGSELIDLYKSRVYTKSHRAYCVFGDGITVDEFEDAPAWLLAALPAGMRAGEYCQRPISNLQYNGCSADNKIGFAPGELRELASRGVWILANTADGDTVYNYHQLSTDMSDKKLQEQSYTTNFDNISRGARALLAPYYGNSNISEEFLNQIHANLIAFLNGKRTNAPSVEIGPQLIEYSNLTIEQDPVNLDAVYMQVDYEMPAPFNHVTLRQRLI